MSQEKKKTKKKRAPKKKRNNCYNYYSDADGEAVEGREMRASFAL